MRKLIIVVLAASLAVGFGCAFSGKNTSDRVSNADQKFAKKEMRQKSLLLKLGMNKKEVESIFGTPYKSSAMSRKNGGHECQTYYGKHNNDTAYVYGAAYVLFINGRVVAWNDNAGCGKYGL